MGNILPGALVFAVLVGAASAMAAPYPAFPPSPAEDRVVAMDYELHLREGFGGETVVIEVDGAEMARLKARTRMQIGLAHIEKLGQLKPGQMVAVRLPDLNLSAEHRVVAGRPFILVMQENGALRIEASETTPGYL